MLKGIFVGLWRAVSSPGMVLCLWLANVVVALPAAVILSESLESSIGSSLVHEELAAGFDMDWYGEFQRGAGGLEATFTPTVVGAGAFYNNIEGWLYGGLFQLFPGVVALGVIYALLWALFVGGILDRFSNSGLFTLSRFFSAGGRFFFRFLRLAVLAGVFYYLVYQLAGWLFGRIEFWTRDVTVERTVLMYVLLGTAVVVFLLTLINAAFDYAKIATFVEDRRSMLLAALRGIRFRPFQIPPRRSASTTHSAWWEFSSSDSTRFVAPGAAQSTVTGVVLAFLIGQAYLVAKLMLRLAFLWRPAFDLRRRRACRREPGRIRGVGGDRVHRIERVTVLHSNSTHSPAKIIHFGLDNFLGSL